MRDKLLKQNMHRDKQQNKLVIKVKKTEQGTEQVAEQDWRIEQAKKIEFSSSKKMFFELKVEHMDKNVCAFLLSSNSPHKGGYASCLTNILRS